MSKDIMNLVGTEAEVCGSLGLEGLRLGRQPQRLPGNKVGECSVTCMWIAGVWPIGAPKACFVYAEAENVTHQHQPLPDWKRLAMVWRDGSNGDIQQLAEPVDMESDPLAPALAGLNLLSTVEETRNTISYFLLGETQHTSYDLLFSGGCAMRRIVETSLWDVAKSLTNHHHGIQHYLDIWSAARSTD